MAPLYDPSYDPLWALCEELDVPVNSHGGTGSPDYGTAPVAALLQIAEARLLLAAAVRAVPAVGRVRALPAAQVRDDRDGLRRGSRGLLAQLDGILDSIRGSGSIGELRYTKEHVLPRSATEYFHQNCWVGVSQPGPADAAIRDVVGADRFMWGSDYPHDEGT